MSKRDCSSKKRNRKYNAQNEEKLFLTRSAYNGIFGSSMFCNSFMPTTKAKAKAKANSYTFRGAISTTQIVNDCIKDHSAGFIVIGEKVYFGVISRVRFDKEFKSISDLCVFMFAIDGYAIFSIDKSSIPEIMKYITAAAKRYRRAAQKLARKIRKRNKARAKRELKNKGTQAHQNKVITF